MEGNISENWRRWRQRFELFLVASGAAEKPEGTKVAILLHTVGEEALEAYNTFKWETGEEKKVDTVLESFRNTLNLRRTQYLKGTSSTKENSYRVSPSIII